MSARSFKVFTGVLLAHLVGLSAVWVGFSVPFPRPPATFTYQGALPAQDTGGGAGPLTSNQFVLDHFEASYFNHWTTLREPSK